MLHVSRGGRRNVPIAACVGLRRLLLLAALALLTSAPARADCASDCQGAYSACPKGSSYAQTLCLGANARCLQSCGARSGTGTGGFGAIAYSVSSGTHGYSYGQASQAAAEAMAVRQCQLQGGASDCAAVLWFNHSCGALAANDRHAYGAEWAASTADAERKAVATCLAQGSGSCTVARSFCSR